MKPPLERYLGQVPASPAGLAHALVTLGLRAGRRKDLPCLEPHGSQVSSQLGAAAGTTDTSVASGGITDPEVLPGGPV